jgi:glycosyltransferase involved in cell wall biosynthesis
MLDGKRIAVVLPAFNAAKTLKMTYEAIPRDVVDDIILVDDFSSDDTYQMAQELGIHCERHPQNRGYGANQKTCYRIALARGADIVVMLHPDYQYEPKLVTAMAAMIASGVYDVCLASRFLAQNALRGGMPLYKFVANRFLTAVGNLLLGQHLSEYHTGYRTYSRRVLEAINLEKNSDDFVFDNQILAQVLAKGFSIGEISCPTKYFDEASSINFRSSVVYGFGVLKTALRYRLHRWNILQYDLLN